MAIKMILPQAKALIAKAEALYNISLEDLYYDVRSWQTVVGEETSFVV